VAFDYVIVGAGLFGSIFARRVAEAGGTALVVERRPHIGGNCYTESLDGIEVHRYGPHIFHTDSSRVWEFVTRFTRMNHYRHRGLVRHGERLLSFPINLCTLHQLWGVRSPAEAEAKLAEVRVPCDKPRNLEEWILAQVGRELYETFIRGYTQKQWGRDPAELPAAIIRRLPIRLTWDDSYFGDRYQGIPEQGYTRLFENLLDHPRIRVQTSVDFLAERRELSPAGRRLVYSGPIDQFFDYRYGPLEYRSLRFDVQRRNDVFQGAAVVNYTAPEVPFTRIIEHKHFALQTSDATVLTYEYPQAYTPGGEAFYPIRDTKNAALYDRYRLLAAHEAPHVIFGGRLGSFQYYDMHQVIGEALAAADSELGQTASRRAA
jgi:UDP-galactopyranose mutase